MNYNKTIDQSKTGIVIKALSGFEAKAYFEQIANLRISMFKKFPYLYEGSLENEKEYLNIYFNSPNCVVITRF